MSPFACTRTLLVMHPQRMYTLINTSTFQITTKLHIYTPALSNSTQLDLTKKKTILDCKSNPFPRNHPSNHSDNNNNIDNIIITAQQPFRRTGSVTSRGSDESKSRRVFGSLLRRHTSFGASDAARTLTPAIATANSQDNIDG